MADKVKLTKRIIDAAVPTAKEHILWDTEVGGLGLRVRPTGSKVFVLVFRHGGRLRKLTLKRYGVITLDQARDDARVALGRLAVGDDPTEDKRAARQPQPEPEPERTLKALVERYLKQAESWHKPATLREDRRLLNKVILERLGKETPVRDITRAHVTGLQEMLATSVTGPEEVVVTHHPAANAALRRLSGLLSYAESIDWRPVGSNPCRGVRHFKEEKRVRYLTAAELKRLGKVLQAEEDRRAKQDKEDPAKWSRSASLLVSLLLYTGLRPGEVLAMRWEDIDREKGLLRLPDAKTGARTVALSAVALKVLTDWPGIEGNPWVIPGKRIGSHLANPGKPWSLIRKAAGLEDVHLHDLRHTYASWAASGGVSLYLVASMLGHAQASTTERYAHLKQDPVRAASDRTASDIQAAMEGRKPAKVVKLRS